MVQFNELRITFDAKYLIIDAFINRDYYTTGATINNIKIIHIPNEDNYEGVEVFNKDITQENLIVYTEGYEKILVHPNEVVYTEGPGLNRIILKLKSEDLSNTSLYKGMFKVQISCSEPDQVLEDNYINTTITSLVFDMHPFYQETLKYLKDFCYCGENKYLINAILRLKALELSAKTGNYDLTAYYWFKYFNTNDKILPNHG